MLGQSQRVRRMGNEGASSHRAGQSTFNKHEDRNDQESVFTFSHWGRRRRGVKVQPAKELEAWFTLEKKSITDIAFVKGFMWWIKLIWNNNDILKDPYSYTFVQTELKWFERIKVQTFLLVFIRKDNIRNKHQLHMSWDHHLCYEKLACN